MVNFVTYFVREHGMTKMLMTNVMTKRRKRLTTNVTAMMSCTRNLTQRVWPMIVW